VIALCLRECWPNVAEISTDRKESPSDFSAASLNDHAHAETLVTYSLDLSSGLFFRTNSLIAIHEQRHCEIESRPNRLRMVAPDVEGSRQRA
jgi:hypothetical protein